MELKHHLRFIFKDPTYNIILSNEPNNHSYILNLRLVDRVVVIGLIKYLKELFRHYIPYWSLYNDQSPTKVYLLLKLKLLFNNNYY